MPIINKLNKYIWYEFFIDLIRIFFIFFILLLIVVAFDELNSLKKIENIDLILSLKLIFFKVPGILFNFTPFIFLFAGILFHLKLKNRNEIVVIRVIGISNLKLISISAILTLILGHLIVFIINPLVSAITKEYESIKSKIFQKKNSIFINDNGLWILVNNENNNKKIIRIENLDFNKNLVKNVTIFNLSKDFNIQSRTFSKEGIFSNKTLKLTNSIFYEEKKSSKKNIELQVDINFTLTDIQNTFKNSSSISIYEMPSQIKNIQNLGYSTDYLKIEYQKLMSLPVYLLAMVLLSGLMIINLGTNMGYLFYVVIGVIISVILYFLSDLSITMGRTERINLELSVWLPIFFIMLLNFIGLIQVNAK